MSFDPLTAVFDLGKIAIEKLFPDPIKRDEELRKLEELRQNGSVEELHAHVQLLTGQIEINKIEAQHPSLWVAGWRPAIGWVGAIALFLMYVPKSIVMTAMWTYQCYTVIHAGNGSFDLPAFPELGAMDIVGLISSLLGVGVMRSLDKKNGVDTKRLAP